MHEAVTRTRRVLLWMGVLLLLAIAFASLMSLMHSVQWVSSDRSYIAYGGSGRVILIWEGKHYRRLRPGWTHAQTIIHWRSNYWFDAMRRRNGSMVGVVVPSWFVFSTCLVPTGFVWYRARQRRAGLCVNCGYDLHGNESGRCPECGVMVKSLEHA